MVTYQPLAKLLAVSLITLSVVYKWFAQLSERWHYLDVQYADDTNISFAASTTSDLEVMINNVLANVNTWSRANKLSLNVQ